MRRSDVQHKNILRQELYKRHISQNHTDYPYNSYRKDKKNKDDDTDGIIGPLLTFAAWCIGIAYVVVKIVMPAFQQYFLNHH